MKISRNDLYARDETGGEWFEEFLRTMAEQPTATQIIMDAINKKQGETVEDLVGQYKEALGLDTCAEEKPKQELKVQALRPISQRHASMFAEDKEEKDKGNDEAESVVVIIEGDPNLKADLESILENSGGTRNTHAIINFLRNMLGRDQVSYSDDQLKEYIETMKTQYTHDIEEPRGDVGRVGMEDSDYYDDETADYMEHGKGRGA